MTILISHIDLDGFGVNILNSLFSEDLGFDDIKNKNYGFEEEQEVKELINKDNDLIIVDLSIPENTYKEWKEKLHSLIIIDHHESSKYLKDYEGNIWSDEQSGTSLFWNFYLKPILIKNKKTWSDKIEYFVKLVDCYDRWQEDSELWLNATRLNKVNQALKDRFVSHMVEKLTTLWEWSAEEEYSFIEIERAEDEIVATIEQDLSIKTDNSGYNFAMGCVPEKGKLSMVCSKLLHKYPEIDYFIGYNPHSLRMSFRSNKDYVDLTKIHGVFGHKNSAGSECDTSDFYKLLLEDCCVTWVKDNTRKSSKVIVENINNN